MAPIEAILYDGEERKAVRIMVRPRCEFPAVLAIFNAMRFPDTGIPDEQISFAILELVSNSMRAHVERGSEDSIVIRLWIKGGLFMATVSDRGGGFDPARLPYSFDAPVASLNVMAPEFVAYRERYDNSRFGMGLVAVRKIFPIFSLTFVDGSDAERAWPSPDIEGTKIALGLPMSAREPS